MIERSKESQNTGIGSSLSSSRPSAAILVSEGIDLDLSDLCAYAEFFSPVKLMNNM